jgi:FkbM family methyltransferase
LKTNIFKLSYEFIMMDSFKDIFRKFIVNFKIDFSFVLCGRISAYRKFEYLVRKYLAIIFNSRRIKYLGGIFIYDNRFVPAILQMYPPEILEMNKVVNFNNINSILDIGANVGQFSYTLKKLFPNIDIYSFEPNKLAFEILKHNLNKIEGAKVFNLAIGLKSGKRKLFFSPDASAEGSFLRDNLSQNYPRKNIEEVTVRTIKPTLNNLRKIGLPEEFDAVKIDVEGAEEEVLKSLKEIKFKYLIVEVSVRREGADLAKILELIKNELNRTPKVIQYILPDKKSPAANTVIKIMKSEEDK